MKRSWIGFFLLLVLLGMGLLAAWAMEEIHESVSEKLEDAADHALREEWPLAAGLAASARKDWEKWHGIRACLADHAPMEEVEALFAELEIYGVSREKVAFAALCRVLSRKIETMGEAHGLVLENIL